MNAILQLLEQYGPIVLFVNLLLEQLGLPLPAFPVLILTGALSVDGRFNAGLLLLVAVAACLIADLFWYATGRRHGHRVLRLVCRISMSPDSCVRQTESLFSRWGVASLLVAKFIPGFATIATALCGNQRVPLLRFLLMDALGAALFAGTGIALGVVFHQAVSEVIIRLQDLGRLGVLLLVGGLAAFFAVRWFQRYRLIRTLRMDRISVDELQSLMQTDSPPRVLDVRSEAARALSGSIPGAHAWSLTAGSAARPDIPRDAEVILYCACPNEASAAMVAKQLLRAGFTRVRPLHGGIDAWIASGLPVERLEPGQPAR